MSPFRSPVNVSCPGCGRSIQLDDSELQMKIECAKCDTIFRAIDGTILGQDTASLASDVFEEYEPGQSRGKQTVTVLAVALLFLLGVGFPLYLWIAIHEDTRLTGSLFENRNGAIREEELVRRWILNNSYDPKN